MKIVKTENEKYCHECAEPINRKAEICPKCGVRQEIVYGRSTERQEQEKRWIVSLVLCWFLGVFGAHRFYTGHTAIGVVQLLTLGGCGIWVLIDFIILLTGSFKDADGVPIKY